MKMKIPPESQEAFERLMKTLPPKLKNNEEFQKTTLTYLVLGGESLARHYLDVSRLEFPDVSLLLQHTPLVEPDRESDDNTASNEDDDENETDIDNNED